MNTRNTTNNSKSNKYQKLVISIILDLIGVLTSSLVIIGDFADIIWAPFTAWMMMRMFKGTAGKIAGIISFIEEIIPGIDIIPTFTLMWIYTYLIKGKTVEKFIKLEDK